MKALLYHYSHCPFCIRVRMAAGFLKIDFDTQLLRYDDEETPTKLIGKKMLPVWVEEGKKPLPESLDIILHLDTENKLQASTLLKSPEFKVLEEELNKIGSYVHSLVMPYWIYTSEFDEKSRAYFQKKKEVKRGSFSELVKKRKELEDGIKPLLTQLEEKLTPFYNSKEMTVFDILVAAHIWGLYMLPEFQFTPKLHSYLQTIKELCQFNYLHEPRERSFKHQEASL